MDGTPIRFFLVFFREDKTSAAPDVSSSFLFIPRTNSSLVVISCYGYDVISSR